MAAKVEVRKCVIRTLLRLKPFSILTIFETKYMYFQVNSWLIIDCGYEEDGTPVNDECSIPFTKRDWTRACSTFGVSSQSGLLQAAEDDENNSSDDDDGDVEDQEDIDQVPKPCIPGLPIASLGAQAPQPQVPRPCIPGLPILGT